MILFFAILVALGLYSAEASAAVFISGGYFPF
jgi:hypothetical protein